jgi:hypothetical protein
MYGEWLSEGTLTDSIKPDGTDIVELQTLIDLVDVAADTGGRVLSDPTQDCYTTPGEQYNYVCWPPIHAYDDATVADEETPDEEPPQTSQSKTGEQQSNDSSAHIADDSSTDTVDTTGEENENKAENGILSLVRSRLSGSRGGDHEEGDGETHDQSDTTVNADTDRDASKDILSSSAETSQHSQDFTDVSPKLTDSAENNDEDEPPANEGQTRADKDDTTGENEDAEDGTAENISG